MPDQSLPPDTVEIAVVDKRRELAAADPVPSMTASRFQQMLATVEGAELAPTDVPIGMPSRWAANIESTMLSSLAHAYRIGEITEHWQATLAHGKYGERLQEEGINDSTARKYRSLYRSLEPLLQSGNQFPFSPDTGVKKAIKLLTEKRNGPSTKRPSSVKPHDTGGVTLPDGGKAPAVISTSTANIQHYFDMIAKEQNPQEVAQLVVDGLVQLYRLTVVAKITPPAVIDAEFEIQQPGPFPKALKAIKPIYGYIGGKTGLAARVITHCGHMQKWGPELEFREPFLGGGSITLNMLGNGLASRVWINDADEGIATLWTMVIKEPDVLCKMIRDHHPKYASICKMSEDLRAGALHGPELALAKLCVVATSYGGRGEVAPTPRKDAAKYWSPRKLQDRVMEAHQLLKGKVRNNECTCIDAEAVIREPGPSFSYLDPPYVKNSDVYLQPFDEAKHRSLAETLRQSNQPWLLSYDDDPLIRKLYHGEEICEVNVRRGREHDPADTSNNPYRKELLVCPHGFPEILKMTTGERPIMDLLQDWVGK